MGPIFNKKVTKKCNLWDREQHTYALFTVDKVNYCGLEKKKEKENVEKKCRRGFHYKPNGHIDIWVSMKSRHAWLNIHFYYFFEESFNL